MKTLVDCSLFSVVRKLSIIDSVSGRFLGFFLSVEFFPSRDYAQSVCDGYSSHIGSWVSLDGHCGILDSVSVDCVTDFFSVCD